ncbi:hypothetical protein CO230_08710 [Chryseobacterium sp. 6424]|uniref:Clp protease ClpP n=1 Tax=Chryseobacterium sp. 6424 TaxID=2039166 RepID=UPI000EFBCAC0|nr:Clp protease ClpP [Chryseobacterium sp. 6424]AYO58195.1 hypothetical protein CO230_08710 [Chryseobacterium sp. 6424]
MHKNKDFRITATTTNSVLQLSITGRIWQGEVANAIKVHIDGALGAGITEAEVYINCVGGSVFEAQEVVNELKRIANVNLIIGSLAASAATYIMCHFPAQCYQTSQFMIHKPATDVFGNEDDVKADLKALEILTNTYRSAYAKKMNKPEADIEAMWQKDYWMDAKEAQALGLVDSIIDEEIQADTDTIAMMVACGCPNIPQQQPTKKENMSLVAIAAALGAPAQSTEAEVLAKVTALATAKTNGESERDQWKQKFEALQKDEASALVDKAVALGLIPEALKETTIGSFTAENFEAQKASFTKLISDKEAENVKDGRHTAVASAIGGKATGATAAGAEKTFDYLQKHNPAELRRIAEKEPEKYQALATDYANGVRHKA